MKQIPNIFTLLNLVFGCIAIVFALQTDAINIFQGDDLTTSFNMPEKLTFAAICIGIAAIIDFLDGFIARLFNASSELGKQLDSLSDVVSFGVAPAVILYQFLRLSFMQEENAFDVNTVWLMPAFIFAAAGAFRLARFNIDPSQAYGFKGVPIPAAGLVIASLPLIAHYNYFDGAVNVLLFNKWFLYVLILMTSYLMISKLPLMALKFKNPGILNNLPKVFLVIVAILAAILLKWLAVPVVFISYIALSLMFKNKAT
ncbi:MAG: CDP-alcohol phosphatidyltransferase family protein [Chitinophagaceae bacterium]